jgi:hypothetical protein
VETTPTEIHQLQSEELAPVFKSEGPAKANRDSDSALQSTSQFPNEASTRPELVRRCPGTLQLHPVLARLNLLHSSHDLNRAVRLQSPVEAPILIAKRGDVIGGFSEWWQAIKMCHQFINCIEYSLTDEEALEFILRHHKSEQSWNDFVRIRVALELEPTLQTKALGNQIAGGKYKGSANLPKAEQIDVRRDIALLAGVGCRNVSNVKTILKKAHPTIIEALSNGTLRIHRALKWCALSHRLQQEQLAIYAVERCTRRTIRRSLASLRKREMARDPFAVLGTLRNKEVQQPGWLLVRPSRLQRTVILLGHDFFGLHSETESNGA